MGNIKISFSGHDKFDCKLDWIIKGLSEVSKNKDLFSLSINNIEKAIEKLGLGINMIKSLKHWLNIFDLVKDNELTEFGKMVLKFDPYLETIDIFWLLHWNLVKNKNKSTIYFLFFTEFFPNRFTNDSLVKTLLKWLTEIENKISENTIKSDVEVFRRIYMGLFSELDIIFENNHEYFLNFNNKKNISNEAFLYILMDYLDIFNKGLNSISLEELQVGKISLQKMLCMNEADFMERMYSLNDLSGDLIKYSDNAGFRKLDYKEYNKYDFLEEIFN